jgi:hypothetical protein
MALKGIDIHLPVTLTYGYRAQKGHKARPELYRQYKRIVNEYSIKASGVALRFFV